MEDVDTEFRQRKSVQRRTRHIIVCSLCLFAVLGKDLK